MCLKIANHVYAMTDGDALVEKYCGQKEGLAYDVIYPVFSFIQLYFIFKYGNVIVNRNQWLGRFTVMHALHQLLAFILAVNNNETLDALVKKYFLHKESDCHDSDHTTKPSSNTEDDDF